MTQMQTDQTTLYSVQGKDRFSDPWITYEARFRWQAEQWAEQRAFVIYDEDGQPVITERLARQAYIEHNDPALGWAAYTAPEPYGRAWAWLERHDKDHPDTLGFYRLVEMAA